MDENDRRLQEAAELAAASGITPFGEMGAQIHELYENMKKSGFDTRQALYLAAAGMTGNPGLPPPS